MRTVLLLLALALPLHARAQPQPHPPAPDPVTAWTTLADRIGLGGANWRTLAIMHQAMHDARNAVEPRYERWFPPAFDEPKPGTAAPDDAMAAAAIRVLIEIHPDQRDWIIETARVLLELPPKDDARNLGAAIGIAAVRRRLADGYDVRRAFKPGPGVTGWQLTPTAFITSNTTDTRPFLVPHEENPAQPPPGPEDQRFKAGLAETLRVGGSDSTARTEDQTAAAYFWAYQSSQRGFVALGTRLLADQPPPGGTAEAARIMSVLTGAMADSAILVWSEKERFSYWRPITSIRTLVPNETDWSPLIETPPHPEYPSGHASDCYTGAFTLERLMPGLRGPFSYQMQLGMLQDSDVGMGQHAQARPGINQDNAPRRSFPTLTAAARECDNARIWAGAHLRPANDESSRIGAMLAERGAGMVPPVK